MGFTAITQDYPWDKLIPYRQRAAQYPGEVVDLSIGTPVDPTPPRIQAALQEAANSPGYPTVLGTDSLQEAMINWLNRNRGVQAMAPGQVMPCIGSKEIVATLPSLLGIGPGDVVVIPEIAYPTYEVGAQAAGAQVLVADRVDMWRDRSDVKLVWLNSPSNPTGGVLPAEHLREVVAAARAIGAVVASDECYAQLAWEEPWASRGVPSVLSHEVVGEDHSGVLLTYSLSKQSNLAGYRAAFLAGDRDLMEQIILMRRHFGMMIPGPVQEAMEVALNDDEHAAQQYEIYHKRRQILKSALQEAGFTVDQSEAGLYLWTQARDNEDCWSTLAWLADRGIVAGPGEFYGNASHRHVRIALTAPDSAIATAAQRLKGQEV